MDALVRFIASDLLVSSVGARIDAVRTVTIALLGILEARARRRQP
jgi:hypothetical protein